jgi:hypothetical protein
MKLHDYKTSLPPVVKVSSLKSDVRANQELIQAIAVMKLNGGSLPTVDNNRSAIKGFVSNFNKTHKNTIANMSVISKLLDQLPSKLGTSTATTKELTILALVDFTNIYASYVPKYIIEATKRKSSFKGDAYRPNKRSLRELKEDVSYFKSAHQYLTMSPKRLTTLVNEVPHLKVTETNDSALTISRILPSGTNPLTAIKSGFVGNPIYHLRLHILQFQMWRYERQRDEVQQLELLLISLKEEQAGSHSPGVEKEIEAIDERIKATNRKMHNFYDQEEEDTNGF